jgi:hypothetical protein
VVSANGLGREGANASCCDRVYKITFRIVSVRGTLTRATALYRVMSFTRYDKGQRELHIGEIGKLLLKNGIAKNSLTRDFFCSNLAWGATGACGA